MILICSFLLRMRASFTVTGLSRHGSASAKGAACPLRDQRGNRTRCPQAGSEDTGRKAQSNADRLGQLLLFGSGQPSLQCGRSSRPPKAASVALRQTCGSAAGLQTVSGGVSSRCVWSGAVTTPYRESSVGESVSLFREPDAGKLPVRFDEREQETRPGQTGLRGRGESRVTRPLRDYRYCACSRLYPQDQPILK